MNEQQIQQAEDAQCDALCSPNWHTDDEGNIICYGCGAPIWLVENVDEDRQRSSDDE